MCNCEGQWSVASVWNDLLFLFFDSYIMMRSGEAIMQNQRHGFTILELLSVIAIIGTLATALLPNVLQARNKAYDSTAQSYIYQVVVGVEARRNTLSQTLPTSTGDCFFYTDLPADPQSVKQCKYEPSIATDSYKITAESASGEIFHFDGTHVITATSY